MTQLNLPFLRSSRCPCPVLFRTPWNLQGGNACIEMSSRAVDADDSAGSIQLKCARELSTQMNLVEAFLFFPKSACLTRQQRPGRKDIAAPAPRSQVKCKIHAYYSRLSSSFLFPVLYHTFQSTSSPGKEGKKNSLRLTVQTSKEYISRIESLTT